MYCQKSGAETAEVCPQWDFTASGGSYSGCLRRRCDNPVVGATYIPGCWRRAGSAVNRKRPRPLFAPGPAE